MFQEWINILNKADKKNPNWVKIWNACSNAFSDFEIMMMDTAGIPDRSNNAASVWIELQKAMAEACKVRDSSGYGSMAASASEGKTTQEKTLQVAHERMSCFLAGFFNLTVLDHFNDPITLTSFVSPVLISEHPEMKIKQTISFSSFRDHYGKNRCGVSSAAMTWPKLSEEPIPDHLMRALLAWREVLEPFSIFSAHVPEGIRLELKRDRQDRVGHSDMDIYLTTTAASLNATLLRDAARTETEATGQKSSWGCCCSIM